MSLGASHDYSLVTHKCTNAQVALRWDLAKSYFLLKQNLDTSNNQVGDLALSWHSKGSEELGLLANVGKENTSLEFALSRAVKWQWKCPLSGDWNLDHDLKAHVGSTGLLKLLVQKQLNSNVKLLLTGHLNVHKLENTHPKDFGVSLVYE